MGGHTTSNDGGGSSRKVNVDSLALLLLARGRGGASASRLLDLGLALEVADEHLGEHRAGLVRVADVLERLGSVTAWMLATMVVEAWPFAAVCAVMIARCSRLIMQDAQCSRISGAEQSGADVVAR